MYHIEEPYINTPEATVGDVPFFVVKDQQNIVVYFAVTRGECEAWIETHQ